MCNTRDGSVRYNFDKNKMNTELLLFSCPKTIVISKNLDISFGTWPVTLMILSERA